MKRGRSGTVVGAKMEGCRGEDNSRPGGGSETGRREGEDVNLFVLLDFCNEVVNIFGLRKKSSFEDPNGRDFSLVSGGCTSRSTQGDRGRLEVGWDVSPWSSWPTKVRGSGGGSWKSPGE